MTGAGPPWTQQQQYEFTGTLSYRYLPRSEARNEQRSFVVLAGEGSPTITDGFARVQTIDRAYRTGYSMPQGYNPLGIDIPIRFEATVAYPGGKTPAQIERDIQTLEWMAGRGQLYKGTRHRPGEGYPPIVQVASFFANGSQSNLIPPNAQSPWIKGWLISALQYDQNAIRGPDGDRRRQDVTVSLTEWVPLVAGLAPSPPSGPSGRQQDREPNLHRTVPATPRANTIAKICTSQGITSVTAWTQVASYNYPTLKIRSYNALLKPGAVVRIPRKLYSTKANV